MNKSMFTKLFALVLMVCVVFSLAIVVSSAEVSSTPTATFKMAEDSSTEKHNETTSSKTTYSETNNGYTLNITNGSSMYLASCDGKGNGAIKFGTGSKAGSMKFTVPNDIVKVELLVAKYKTNTSKIKVNNTEYTLTKNSNDGAYDIIEVDTSANKTVSFTTVSGGYRVMLNEIRFYAGTGCDHVNTEDVAAVAPTCTESGYKAGVYCKDCNNYISGREVDPATGHAGGEASCTALAKCGTCGEEYGKLLPHNFKDGNNCDVCGAEMPLEATISFANADQRQSLSATQQVWKGDGIVFTHNKSASGTDIANYTAPARFYKSSQIIIEGESSISKIVFNAPSGDYGPDIWKNSIGNVDGATVTVEGNDVIVEFSTPVISFEIAAMSAQGRLNSVTVTFVKEESQPEAPSYEAKASVVLGKDLAMIYDVVVPAGTPTMVIAFADETVTLNGTSNGDGTYTFIFDGIGPHQMAEIIKAALYVDGVEVKAYDDYSVEKNLKNIKNNDANLTDLINATLVYGAQAEAYKGIKNGVDLTGIEVNNAAIADDANAIECKNGADCAFTAAGVNFDSANRIYVKFKVTGNFNFYVNGTVVELEKSEDGSYKFYTDALTAKQFDDEFTFVIETEDSMATLVYSVNSYAYAMQNDVEMANLVKALYAYGAAAEKYTA